MTSNRQKGKERQYARRGTYENRNGESANRGMGDKIKSYRDLRVYQNAMEGTMEIFELTKSFRLEEKYSMVDQMRRSSRSVCTNIGEACLRPRGNDVCICAP